MTSPEFDGIYEKIQNLSSITDIQRDLKGIQASLDHQIEELRTSGSKDQLAAFQKIKDKVDGILFVISESRWRLKNKGFKLNQDEFDMIYDLLESKPEKN